MLGSLNSSAETQGNACRLRRRQFSAELKARGLDAALLRRPQNLAYFFGLWGWRSQPAAGYITAEDANGLAIGRSADCTYFADSVMRFDDSYFGTSLEMRENLAVAMLEESLAGVRSVGTDVPSLDRRSVPISPLITAMRRNKDPAELALIAAAVVATEAGYRAVQSQIRPGLLEIELYAAFYAAAIVAAGKPMDELGNDFRGGSPGGRPRSVPLIAGDLIPLDAGAVIGGYHADLCRTFAVSGKRDAAQEDAFGYVDEALSRAESMVMAGSSCGDLFEEIRAGLDGRNGWRFDHHLGHGIGLEPVEAPFINSGSRDVFEEGDTFTLEPGLYGKNLRAGVRLEQNYVIENGLLRRLSTLPLDLHSGY